jgi:hypothetical protein
VIRPRGHTPEADDALTVALLAWPPRLAVWTDGAAAAAIVRVGLLAQVTGDVAVIAVVRAMLAAWMAPVAQRSVGVARVRPEADEAKVCVAVWAAIRSRRYVVAAVPMEVRDALAAPGIRTRLGRHFDIGLARTLVVRRVAGASTQVPLPIAVRANHVLALLVTSTPTSPQCHSTEELAEPLASLIEAHDEYLAA